MKKIIEPNKENLTSFVVGSFLFISFDVILNTLFDLNLTYFF